MIEINYIHKKVLCIILAVFIFITSITPIFALFKESDLELIKDTVRTHQPKELVINTVKPCTKGTLTISKNGNILYVYLGEIKIINDGSNGELIEIYIDYQYENLK